MVIIFHLFIRLPVNKLRPRLRVDKFLARIQAVITRQTKADCNHQHEKRHRLIAKKFKAQKKRRDRAVCDSYEESQHTAGGHKTDRLSKEKRKETAKRRADR